MSVPVLGFLFTTAGTALAVAAGVSAVPVLIHLLSRRRFRVVNWAAMRFLLAAQRQNVRRVRLEQLLLLAVRTLAVLLLVLAMASVMPWAERLWQQWFPTAVAGTVLGTPRTHHVLVLDVSLSMNARVAGEQTAFDRARQRAGELLARAPAGDGFQVVLLADPPSALVPQPSEAADRVAAEIAALRPQHGNADVRATLALVEEMLRQSPDKYEARQVTFFTDVQAATWTARPTAIAAEALRRLQAQAATVIVDVGRDGLANLAITHLEMAPGLPTTGGVVPITATVRNFGGEERRQVRVELLMGQARAAAGDPLGKPRVVQQQVVNVPAGQAGVPVVFPVRFPTPGAYVVQLRGDRQGPGAGAAGERQTGRGAVRPGHGMAAGRAQPLQRAGAAALAGTTAGHLRGPVRRRQPR
jgi:hypothetical protein